MLTTETVYFQKDSKHGLGTKSKKELDAELNGLEKKLGALVSLSAPYRDASSGALVALAAFRSPDQTS